MQTNVYTLPEINFVGGETQTLDFHLKNTSGDAFDAYGANTNLSICNYSNKDGTPLLSYTPTILEDERGVASVLSVTIDGADTAGLSGKYVYQITIIDLEGKTEIPNQGIMNITKNIHQEFIPRRRQA